MITMATTKTMVIKTIVPITVVMPLTTLHTLQELPRGPNRLRKVAQKKRV